MLIILSFLIITKISYAKTLVFGVYGSERRSLIDERFRPIIKKIETNFGSELNEPVIIKNKFFPDYIQGVNAIVGGEVDFMRLGAASYIQAKNKNSDLSIIAIEAKKGVKYFYGLICVKSDSSINSLKDLKGKRFAFGNKESTIGRYLAQYYLYKNGIRGNDLLSYDYLGKHDKVAVSVIRNQFDAGAFKEGIYNHNIFKGRLKIIFKFKNISQAWVARSSFPKKEFELLSRTLLNISDKSSKSIFLPGNDGDYDFIRDAIDNNSLFFEQ